MSKLISFLTSGASGLVDSIGAAIDRNVTTTAEKEALKNEASRIAHTFLLEAQAQSFEEMANARNREVQLKNSAGGIVTSVIAMIIIFCFVAQLILPWTGLQEPDTPGYHAAVKTLEYLTIALGAYYWGSSRGSHLKDQTRNPNKNE
jgi:hypothetical protein